MELFLSIIRETESRKRKSSSAQKCGDEADEKASDCGAGNSENELVIDTELDVTLKDSKVIKVRWNGKLIIEVV